MPFPPEAEKKFWKTPELVDRLMPFLDGQSTLSLVTALPLALEIVKGKASWIQLVKRVCPFETKDAVDAAEWEKQVAKERMDVLNLVEILKMMELEDPSPLLLDLLHVICKNFPPVDRDEVPEEAREPPSSVNQIPGPEFIQVTCTCEQSTHALSPYGFPYLEQAERAMGTTKQKVQRVVTDILEEPCQGPWLTDLESRMLRQQNLGVGTEVDVSRLICKSKENAEAISTLMQHCQRVDVQDALCIEADIGTEGWTALGKALSWKHVGWIDSDKVQMASANREDLKAIWEGVDSGWFVWLEDMTYKLFENWDNFEKFVNAEEDLKQNEEDDGDEDNKGQI